MSRLGQRLIAEARFAKWEAQIEAAMRRALAAHRRRVEAGVRGALTAAAPPVDPFDEAVWTDTLGRELVPVLHQVFAEITANTVTGFFDDPSSMVPVDLTHHLDRMVGHMAGLGPEMGRRLGDTLTEGFNAGEGWSDLERRVRDTFGVGRRRAATIARTETVGAANGASHEVAGALRDGGLNLEKEWLATGDRRTRPTHRAADGQRVAFDAKFIVGICELDHPHDPNAWCAEEVVNCRCTTLYPEVEAAPAPAPEAPITEEATRRAYRSITPYRANARAEARRVVNEEMAHLDQADVAGLATPPQRHLVIDPISGQRRWTRGPGGEWDWFDHLAPGEQNRLRGWMRKGTGSEQFAPDLLAQRWTDLYGGDPADVGSVMEEWVAHTRRHDAAKALARGRLPSESAYGDLNVNDVLPDTADRFDVGVLFGDVNDAAAYVARLRRDEAVEAIAREFTDAQLGPAPWAMTEEQWVTELFATQDRVLAGRVVGHDEWGDTYTPDAEAALARLAELVPRGLDPWGADIDTAHATIVELAVRAGLTGG